ncbi:MAG: hypothetical protein ACNA8H_11755 [Anaerolineales bacterium]
MTKMEGGWKPDLRFSAFSVISGSMNQHDPLSKSTLLRTFLSGRNSNTSLRAPFALSAATHSPPWLSHESLLFP